MKKIKSYLSVLLLLLLMLPFPQPVFAADDIALKIDDYYLTLDVPPTIVNGRTLVPIRAIFESLGATVEWNAANKSITGTRSGTTIYLQVDNKTALKNEQAIVLDVPAMIINSRTMVPARFIAEALGAEVNWLEDKRTVAINSLIPYGLSEYYILEYYIKQVNYGFDLTAYNELQTAISNKFSFSAYELLEEYLLRTYQSRKESNGTYTGTTSGVKLQGVYQWDSGSKYVGDWVNGEMEGKGAYYWIDGSKYVGEWHSNQRNGWGILYTADGDTYIGEWVNDRMDGSGIYQWSNSESYIGQFSSNQRNGLGLYTWNNGNSYLGQQVYGDLSGLGRFTWYDEEQYLGEYLYGAKNGSGIYYWRSDFSFRGEYVNDIRSWGTYQGPGGLLLNLEEKAHSVVSQVVQPGMGQREKLKALHDYVVLQTNYDKQSYSSNNISDEAHTAYGVFANKLAVCDGYTEALHILLEAAGIENEIIFGEAKADSQWEGHAWLKVNINGSYSNVDVTWADPDQGDSINYDYFLVSDEKISVDHRWDS